MANRDRATIDVDLVSIPAHFFIHTDRLCGEGFVDFHQVDFFVRPTCFFQAQWCDAGTGLNP